MATLAEVLRQAGYVTPQGQVVGPRTDLAQKLKSYVMNIPQNAAQNLANQRADIDAALTMGDKGIQIGDRAAFERQMAEVPNLMGLTAYHGTPHTIKGKFDISKVGTGEGAQAYGHGMYFAENPNVAKQYQKDLSNFYEPYVQYGKEKIAGQNLSDVDLNVFKYLEMGKKQAGEFPHNTQYYAKKIAEEHNDLEALKKLQEQSDIKFGEQYNIGNLYKVDIPDEYIPNMLDWDKPLSVQPQIIQKLNPQTLGLSYTKLPNGNHAFVNSEGKKFGMLQKGGTFESFEKNWMEDLTKGTGADFYKKFGQSMFGQDTVKTSETLNNAGIKGIRYLDAGSRGKSGTSNFVVFEPSNVKILEENSKPMTRKEIIEQELEKVAK
jgi:hypothetical protein